MKTAALRTLCYATALAIAAPPPIAFAQDASQAAAAPAATPFKQEEIEALVAPIALYPDELLVQTLMASTYPLEIVQAARWQKEGKNKDLKGDALAKALEPQEWDPSVKSIVAFPQVLIMMNDKLDWTQKLGDAFLAQQSDVMFAVQRLRQKAEQSGNLKSNEQQTVVTEKETIIIQPANPAGGLRAHLPADHRVWRVALPGLSALLPAAAAWILRGQRACLGARVRYRRGGRRLPVGLGQSGMGSRRRERQRESVQQHQRH